MRFITIKKLLRKDSHGRRGFTLIELVVCLAIFAFMTAFLVAKYGTFNQSVLISDLAYDTALTIQTAQSYGLNVKSASSGGVNYSSTFNLPYGVDFSSSSTGGANTMFTFFTDANSNYVYDDGSGNVISTYTIRRGSIVNSICVGNDSNSCNTVTVADVVFKRPNPDAIITAGDQTSPTYPYMEIQLKATDGSTKKVIVRSTGEIAVTN